MTNHYEKDRWGTDAPSIMDPARLITIKQAFEQSAIIFEHRFYNGSRAPDRLVFDDYENFAEYLQTKVNPGDSLWFWRYDDLCATTTLLHTASILIQTARFRQEADTETLYVDRERFERSAAVELIERLERVNLRSSPCPTITTLSLSAADPQAAS